VGAGRAATQLDATVLDRLLELIQFNSISFTPLRTADRLALAWHLNSKWQYDPDP
jgi:hypothetical protein